MVKKNSNKFKQFISVVVYARNNGKDIASFLTSVNNILKSNFYNYEFICVNDNSNDNTVNEIRAIAKKDILVPVTIINLPTFHGNEYSMSAGVDMAIGDFVFEFESPISDYDYDEIMKVYHRCLEGYDIVSATRDSSSSFFSRIFYKVLSKTSSLAKMSTESFRVLSRRAINRVNTLVDQMVYRKAVYYNCGLKTDKVVYKSVSNEKILSHTFKYKQSLAVDTLLVYSNFGYRVSLVLSIAMMLVSVSITVYTILVAFFKPTIIEGWLSVMLFLSVSFFALFSLLTIAIKYLSLIVSKLYSKKSYIYESVEKVNKG